jgi:hypothetical protein
MATIRNAVPGAGYGNVYVDSLIWGGTAWDTTIEPIKVYFGQSGDFAEASRRHGPSAELDRCGKGRLRLRGRYLLERLRPQVRIGRFRGRGRYRLVEDGDWR